VLVVDDDEQVLASFERLVGRTRTVLTAKTGRAGAELARRHKPDLVIVDLQLRNESGIDVIRSLKLEHPAMTAVLISGYASVDVAVRAMRAGADDVVSKPITWREILRRFDETGDPPHTIDTPTLERAQWEHIQRVLADCDGNVSMAARKLGMWRSTLQRWLRRHAPSE
jgi:two-component system response regulator RegA